MASILDCARISTDVYNTRNSDAPGWVRGAVTADLAVGEAFFGATYLRGNEVVVAFRGSVEAVDWTDADADIGRGRLPLGQLADAVGYMNRASAAAAQRGITRLVITGHSLGGGLAQLAVGIRPNSVGVTFNAPGCRNLTGAVHLNLANQDVWNYRTARDPVSRTGVPLGRPYVSLPVPATTAERVSRAVGGLPGLLGGYLAGSGNEHRMALMLQALGGSSECGRCV
ncbi:hypothetical protein [Zavarzinia sp.]|uniref:lipase family protein n=1 Tax=Zavarzinia sp. TaxID=2027920 RepID=UPI00356B0885